MFFGLRALCEAAFRKRSWRAFLGKKVSVWPEFEGPEHGTRLRSAKNLYLARV